MMETTTASASEWAALEAEYRRALAAFAGPPGPVHLMGVGGVGVAGLAVLLQCRGHAVSGCDTSDGRVANWLRARGIPVWIGHDVAHLDGREQMIIRTAAVRDDHPEWRAAVDRGIPGFARGIALAALAALARERETIAVAGCHGKTTTTAMIVALMQAARRPCAYAVGGELDEEGRVAEGSPEGPLVIEADESDGTLAVYEPSVAVITNVELDHVDFFGTFDRLAACYRRFADRTRIAVWACGDDPGARHVLEGNPLVQWYGLGDACDLRAEIVEETSSGSRARVSLFGSEVGEFFVPVPGRTNVLNALGAVGAAHSAGIPSAVALPGLARFRPVRRRFEMVVRSSRLTVVSDYAHHPTEIRALLAQVRTLNPRRIIAVFQPHRYTRTAALGADFPAAFEGVDRLILAPVYAASERPVPGGTHRDLAAHFARAGREVEVADSLLEAWEKFRHYCAVDGGVALVIGAGDVEKIAQWAAETFQ